MLNKKLLKKLLNKKKGDKALSKTIFKLVQDFEDNNIETVEDLLSIRPDADKVHADGFYFFNMKDSRTMIMIVSEDDQAAILWCDSHDKYELTFKNNKSTIKKWLKNKNYIE